MAYYTNYKGRRALGARYSKPPEVILDEQRLAQEYALAPERARLKESKRQDTMNRLEREKIRGQQGTASMYSTMGNVAGLGMQAYKAGLFDKAVPSITKPIVGASSFQTALPAGTDIASTGISGTALAPSYVSSGLSAATDAGMAAAMEAGADISGSVAPNTVEAGSSGLLSGISGAASAVAPYMQIHGMRVVGQQLAGGAFNEGARTLKKWGGISEQAGEGMQSFLGNPIKDSANLEDAPEKIIDNVLPKGSQFSTENNWVAKTVTDIFNPVGAGLEWLKKGLASGIGGLVKSIFG